MRIVDVALLTAMATIAMFGCRQRATANTRTDSVSSAEQEGIDPSRLDALIEHARAEHSSAIVVFANGRLVRDERFGAGPHPIAAMSATKSIVALAVAHLVEQGHLPSLDVKASDYIDEWKGGALSSITVRQLLNHTSGIDPQQAKTWEGETIKGRAATTRLVDQPGTRFTYNNNAVDMFSLVVAKAARLRLDDYLERFFFEPLDITGASWQKDSDGQPRAAGELVIDPMDLAKLGQLVLDRGVWRGKRLLHEKSVETLLAAGQPFDPTCGLLFWRELDAAGQAKGWSARGSFGQYLVIDPIHHVVAVRMRELSDADFAGRDYVTFKYDAFREESLALGR